MTSFLLLLAITWLPGVDRVSAGDCPSRFLGTWEFRQAAGDGYDAEGERLEVTCRGNAVHLLYHGLEREGEHGLFYTLVEAKDVHVTPARHISFVVPERELFRQRPQNLEAVKQKRLTSAGITRDELHLEGRLENQKLVLTCTAKGGSCPEPRMVFHR